jgi:hypothetical protein
MRLVRYCNCRAWWHAGGAEEEDVQQQIAAGAGSSAVYQFRPQVEVGAAFCVAAVLLWMRCRIATTLAVTAWRKHNCKLCCAQSASDSHKQLLFYRTPMQLCMPRTAVSVTNVTSADMTYPDASWPHALCCLGFFASCCSLRCLMSRVLTVLRHWWLAGQQSRGWWCVHRCWTMCQTWRASAGASHSTAWERLVLCLVRFRLLKPRQVHYTLAAVLH